MEVSGWLRSCKHTFYGHLSQIQKLTRFTCFIRKLFATKILLSGKFSLFLTLGRWSRGGWRRAGDVSLFLKVKVLKSKLFRFVSKCCQCLTWPWRWEYSQINMRVLFSWASDCSKKTCWRSIYNIEDCPPQLFVIFGLIIDLGDVLRSQNLFPRVFVS